MLPHPDMRRQMALDKLAEEERNRPRVPNRRPILPVYWLVLGRYRWQMWRIRRRQQAEGERQVEAAAREVRA